MGRVPTARAVISKASQADIVAAHGNLTRKGTEYVGSCPSCGGTDRFWVTSKGSIGCRGCNPSRDNRKRSGISCRTRVRHGPGKY